jgi:glycosyltransferase involved in cell wall biosynthesis
MTPVLVLTESFWVEKLSRQIAARRWTHPVSVVEVPMLANAERFYNVFLPAKHLLWTFRVARQIAKRAPLKDATVAYVTLSASYLPPVAFRAVRRLWWGPVGVCPPQNLATLTRPRIGFLVREVMRNIFIRSTESIGAFACRDTFRTAFVTTRTPDKHRTLERRLGARPKCVIPEVLRLSAALPDSALAIARQRQGTGSLRIAFVGDVSRPAKNFPLAVQVLTRLRQVTNRTIVLKVFSRSVPRLDRELQAGVVLEHIPHSPRDDYLSVLAATDLLLFPSLREGYSSTIIEALGLGLSVLALDVGGNSHFRGHSRLTLMPADIAARSSEMSAYIAQWMKNIGGLDVASTVGVEQDFTPLARKQVLRFFERVGSRSDAPLVK